MSTTDQDQISISVVNQDVSSDITARRQGSSAVLIPNADGTVKVERKNTDLGIAVIKHLSDTAMTSIIPIPQQKSEPKILMGAEDAMERTGGKGAGGAYSEHLFPLHVMAEKFSTDININDVTKSLGLTNAKALEILELFGPNVLTPPPKVPLWLLFLLQYTKLLIVLLELVAIACIGLYIGTKNIQLLYVGVLLIICIIVTCYETFSQEAKSDSLMEKFRAMVPAASTVIREGVSIPMDTSNLVIGDILSIKSGDKVPADCRIIFNQGLKVDQSMITGEAEAVESTVNASDINALEARNIIFNGSLCVDGSCLAIVIRTGDATLIGTMVEMTGDVGKSSSTLQKDIEYFVKFLTLFSLFQGVLVFLVGCLANKLDPISVFASGFVVIMIGNIPQGLPTTVTACLFIIADRMGKQNVFVKKLDIIETLGSCTCICTDKTGTLTMNLMSVAHMWIYNTKYDDEKVIEVNLEDKTNGFSQLFYLLAIATLNSRVVLVQKEDSEDLIPNSDATELGIYRLMSTLISDRCGKSIENFRNEHPKIFEIPFNSSNKWQMSIHHINDKDIVFIKGAPDVLLGKCNRYVNKSSNIVNIDDEFNTTYTTVYEDFGGNGERVIGFAMLPLERSVDDEVKSNSNFLNELKTKLIGKDSNNCIKNLVFVGLITLMDPPRKEVPQAIKDCHSAGIRVVMVTGDHPITAEAISKKIGLITTNTRAMVAKEKQIPFDKVKEEDIQAVVVKGSEIPSMTEEDWKILLSKKEIVFARTSPEQKLTIVKEFTKAGNITAMTGDGVNDSPALKQAAIGIAMGLNGSDVAREAADIVLLDDNFASIVVGIKEGRLLFANLKKSVAYTLAHLVPEVLPTLLWAFFGCPQPMGTLLSLCIDLLTELVPATSLAYEEAESLIMQVPPRNVKTDKLTSFPLLLYSYGISGLIITGACFSAYFMTFWHYGISAKDLFSMKGEYFPATSDDSVWITSDGRSYDADAQNNILYQIQGTWYLMIVCCQATHLYVCRTRIVSIFSHGLFTNQISNYGLVIAISLGVFVTYCPGLQSVVQSANPLSLYIFIGTMISFVGLWTTSEARKWFTRTYPNHWLNKILAW